ncbi:hypothetical protein EXU48_08525 [Occultella glacieicola]|uniref:Uncharacterized protein n=1 Tax=Occultella glacieicola TaxID=2518684 RepID=A0ABY2E476_9MICO|nr:hypothetical protein [Occultella glacieicola]TDE94830.1 hypothetical protein EXU48_08525 [Occultella glacieicola]
MHKYAGQHPRREPLREPDGPVAATGYPPRLAAMQRQVGNHAVSLLVAVQRAWVAGGSGNFHEDATGETFNSITRNYTGPPGWTSRTLSIPEAEQLMDRIQADAQTGPVGDQQPVGGGTIDFAKFRAVLDTYDQQETPLPPAEWREMRKQLSLAIVMPNKSHPAHGSNFNKPQKAVTQVKDWANVLSPNILDALKPALNAQFGDNTF